MSVIRLKSLHPVTEYSPQWNIPLYQAAWNEFDKIDTIREGLIRNEKNFLELEYHQDGGTGLGKDSVTSRFGRYNLFDYTDEVPELATLLTFLRKTYVNFIQEDQSSLRDCEIACWFNILRSGEHIAEHCHGSGHDAYLSGNFHLETYETETYYKSPFDLTLGAPFPNNKGVVTLFPSYLTHGTTQFNSDELRVSIAFDLRLTTTPHNKDLKCIPFLNNEILNSL